MCLVLSLTACGESEDTTPASEGVANENKKPIPKDIEKQYEETVAKMIAKELAHTGDGPIFTEEELAELDRLEQQFMAYKETQQKIAHQQEQRAKYQTCVENQDIACSELVRYTSESNREDRRMLTLSIHNSLPENITYQHYFGLTGEDCESDDPVNQWIDADTVTVRYVSKGEVVLTRFGGMGSRQGQCHIERRLKTPDIVFQSDKNPEELTFSYNVPPNIDDVIHVCQDRASRKCRKLFVVGVDGAGEFVKMYGYPGHKVTIINTLPESIAYRHYFSLTDGCISDGPLDQWTDINSIEVYYNGEDLVHKRYDDTIEGKCEVNMQMKITDTDLILKPTTGSNWIDVSLGIIKLEFRIRREEPFYR